MMAIEGQLCSLLDPLVAGGCHPIVNKSPKIVFPYITYQLIGEKPVVTLGGAGGLGKNRFQVDVIGKSYAEAKAKAAEVKTAFRSAPFKATPLFSMDMPPEGDEYRVLLEYSIFS